jgi:RimJ/RimL family protein N-acetyltransferase
VATEYGVVNLFGKTLEERAMAMISIAHPDFRNELLDQAREAGLVSASRTVDESLHGVYPLRLEDIRVIDGEEVLIRPAKPVDGRLIQEHFYSLDHSDVVNRFLYDKLRFARDDVSGMYEVDYIRNLTVLAVTGELGYERAVAVGSYFLDPATHMAEVAYSVAGGWQRKGLSTIIQEKLVQAARDNGILGLTAYVNAGNEGMIRLFKKLPYRVRTSLDGQLVTLEARFDEPVHD